MDLDALAAARRDEWDRLAALGSKSRLSGPESDELIAAYQAGAADHSLIRSTVGVSVHGDRLSLWLGRARRSFTGVSTNSLDRVSRFFVFDLPASLYRIRWLTLAITVASFVVALTVGLWLNANPQYLLHLGTAAQLKSYADQDFVGYYSAHPDAAFAGQVWTHNATLTAATIATGISGIGPIYFLFTNAYSVGQAGAIVAQYGRADHFWLYIAPHGQLELYSIFVSGAAGLMLFWAWVAPGARTRQRALFEEGRAMFTVVIGLIISLAMSGIIEGYVTRQPWPWPVKIGIGTVALLIFLSYQWIVGRRAVREGYTGDLDEFEGGARQLVAG